MDDACPAGWRDVPLSTRPEEGAPTLYTLAYKQCFDWTLRLAEKVRATPGFDRLAEQVGEQCAVLFVEKDLYFSLVPVAHQFVRARLALETAHAEPPLTVSVQDPDVCRLLSAHCDSRGIAFRRPHGRSRVRDAARRSAGEIRDRLALAFGPTGRPLDRSELPRLGCEVAEGVVRSGLRSELFWWDGDTPSAGRLLLFLNNVLPDGQERELDALARSGVTLLRDRFRAHGEVYRRIPAFSRPRGRPWASGGGMPGENRWIHRRVRSWCAQADWWTDFFRRQRVRVWLTVTEFGMDSIAQRAAMDRLGGVVVSRQRSFFVGNWDTLAFQPAHVVVVWEPGVGTYLSERRNRNEVAFAVGHVFGAWPGASSGEARALRNDLLDGGATFVVAVMDNRAYADGELSPDQLREFYRVLIRWTRHRADVAIVVKQKHPQGLLSELGGVDVSDLVQAGRLHVARGPRQSLPLITSLAADLTVSLNLSSAGLEASIAGLRSIFYYPSSADLHPLEGAGKGRIVFDRLDAMESAMTAVYEGRGRAIGLLGDLRETVDAFGDGVGPARTSEILCRLLDADPSNHHAAFDAIATSLSAERSHPTTSRR